MRMITPNKFTNKIFYTHNIQILQSVIVEQSIMLLTHFYSETTHSAQEFGSTLIDKQNKGLNIPFSQC